jgi:hypothetical protein
MNILFKFTYDEHSNGNRNDDYVIAKNEKEAIELLPDGIPRGRKVIIEKLCFASEIIRPIPNN